MSLMLSLKLGRRICIVVGQDSEAPERVLRLLARGARVLWLTRKLDRPAALTALRHCQSESRGRFLSEELAQDIIKEQSKDGAQLQLKAGEPTPDELARSFVVVLSDRDSNLAQRLESDCDALGRLFCAIDQPDFGNFGHVALVDSGPVTIGIGTAGQAPALARKLQVEFRRLLAKAEVVSYFNHLAQLRTDTPAGLRREVLARALSGLSLAAEFCLPKPHSNSGKPESGSGAG